MSHALSKSRFQLGLQCNRLLWLKCHRPELADPITEQQAHIFAQGTTVGELARELFPGGVLLTEDHTQSRQALETTRRLMEDPPRALFEAAFEHAGVFVRPDAIVRADDGAWDLYEVKSSTRLKDEHISDIAVQMWVLQGAGLRVRGAYLVHIDNTYVYAGGDHDVRRLFAAEEVTYAAEGWLPEIPGLVEGMLRMLELSIEPDVLIGKHCDSPHTCAFHGHCHAFLPEQPVTALPRLGAVALDRFLEQGLYAIGDIPTDHPMLTARQRAVCEDVRAGRLRFHGDVGRSLARLTYPLHFLDFETMMSALPLYVGTRPYQQVPFQWSDHVMREDGSLEHREFLFTGEGDPRADFVDSLLDALGDSGSVVVYSSFENTCLKDLARAFPHRAEEIAAVQERLFDLERVVAQHVRHPDCLGHTSIKVVLPALAPHLTYAGLGIAEGGTASLRYLQAATGQLDASAREKVFADLRAYCGTDTLAMVEIYKVLREQAARAA